LGQGNGKHCFAKQKRKHSFAESAKPMGKKTEIVILPMVLQIHNTIVLQGAELEGRDGYL
jgi:hypothetical protein